MHLWLRIWGSLLLPFGNWMQDWSLFCLLVVCLLLVGFANIFVNKWMIQALCTQLGAFTNVRRETCQYPRSKPRPLLSTSLAFVWISLQWACYSQPWILKKAKLLCKRFTARLCSHNYQAAETELFAAILTHTHTSHRPIHCILVNVLSQ